MKKSSKALLLVLCAAMLVTASVMGTLAYLTSTTGTIDNTFTVGNVEITLLETKVDEYGEALTGNDAGTTNAGQPYKMVPGHTYTKDPTITITAKSEPCWLFVKVENGIAKYEATTNTIAAQLSANGWTALNGVTDVYYHDIVDVNENQDPIKVFEEFTIADKANEVQGWSSVTSDNTKVSVTAYAIQSDGMPTASDAWTALGVN